MDEIKQEKAAKSQCPKESSTSEMPKTVTTKSTRGVKRAITVRDDSIGNIRTFSEILYEKKKKQEELQKPSKSLCENNKDKNQGKSDIVASQATENTGQIKVKTLEEIRREKAARLQAQEAPEPQPKSPEQESSAKKPRLLRFKKVTSHSKTFSPKSSNKTEQNSFEHSFRV